MTLGSSQELDERIAEAEAAGFNRDMFPFSVNDHRIVPLLNDGYGNENRTYLDITLFCHNCGMEYGIQGTVATDPEQIVKAKLLLFGPYLSMRCE